MCVYLPVPSVPIYLLAGRAKTFFDGTHIHSELLQNQRLTHNSRKVEEKTFRFMVYCSTCLKTVYVLGGIAKRHDRAAKMVSRNIWYCWSAALFNSLFFFFLVYLFVLEVGGGARGEGRES